MNLELHLKVVGVLMLALAFAHLYFPKHFGWKEELGQVSLLTRQIFWVHCFFICLVLGMCGTLSLVFTENLIRPSPLGRLVLAGCTIFWAARLFIQFFVYDARLWKGNRFHTVMHVLFALLWTYYTTVYAFALWGQYKPS